MLADRKSSFSRSLSRRTATAASAEKYDWTNMHVIQYPTTAFCSLAQHNRQRRSRLASSSCSSNAAMPAKGAVVDRLLTSHLTNEIMIMNSMAAGEWSMVDCLSTAALIITQTACTYRRYTTTGHRQQKLTA